MTIKEKILSYIDYKGIKKTEFYESVNIAASNFKGGAKYSELGSDKLVNILTQYPDLSPDWLLLDSGDMIRERSIKSNTIDQKIDTDVLQQLLMRIDAKDKQIGELREEIGALKERLRLNIDTPADYIPPAKCADAG